MHQRPSGIGTARLRLAPLRDQDADALAAITDDPAITGRIDFLPRRFRRSDAVALIRQARTSADCFFGAWDRADGGLVGVVGTHLHGRREIEVGYWIGRGRTGKGFATEALNGVLVELRRRFARRRIVAECRRDNAASWRVLQKSGFRPTGKAGTRPGRRLFVLVRHRLPKPSQG